MQKPNTTNTVSDQEVIKEQTPKFPTISPSLLGFGGPNTSSRPTARTQGKFGISPFFMSVIDSELILHLILRLSLYRLFF